MSICHVGSMFCFFPTRYISSTYTNKNSPFSRITNEHYQFGTYPKPYFIERSQMAFPTVVLPEDDHYRFRSRGTTGSSILDHDLGHLCLGRCMQFSGRSDFGVFNNVGASSTPTRVQTGPASVACPADPGSLAITSIPYAAVTCDADDPCSKNTA